MYTGAPRVLCSGWKVHDAATEARLAKCCERWKPGQDDAGAAAPLPAAEAPPRAQDFVRAQDRWRHPEYRAAWVQWGLPD